MIEPPKRVLTLDDLRKNHSDGSQRDAETTNNFNL